MTIHPHRSTRRNDDEIDEAEGPILGLVRPHARHLACPTVSRGHDE